MIESTERLVLREWHDDADDVDFLFDTYRREEVQRYLGSIPRPMPDRGEVESLLRRWRGLADGVLGVRAVTTRDGARLGSVLLKRIPWSVDSREALAGAAEDVEIGWHFHPDAWGYGYAAEAAAAVLGAAFDAGLDRVIAVTNPANAASQRVCRRIGMTHLGSTTRYYDTVCELFESRASGGSTLEGS